MGREGADHVLGNDALKQEVVPIGCRFVMRREIAEQEPRRTSVRATGSVLEQPRSA
jgi:hypothetical protein